MKTIKITLAIILLLLSYQTVNARIIHVPADSSTIQKGINGSNNGDTVLVNRGTYYENIDFLGKNILVASNYIFDSLEATVDSTIIDGGGIPTASVVTMRYVVSANSGITGFTIKNGYAWNGGGINCEFSSGRISDNLITSNTAEQYGGGIYCANTGLTLTISGNRIIENTSLSEGGGGIVVEACSPRIVNNLIQANEATWNGGGIHVLNHYSSPEVRHNQILGNKAGFLGGGVLVSDGATPLIDSNTIDYNFAARGGGIALYGTPLVAITNNDIRADTASEMGGGIFCEVSSPLIQLNTIAHNQGAEGGGIYFSGLTGSALVVDNTIVSNFAECGGGIRLDWDAAPKIQGNYINDNLATGGGGGISLTESSSPTISRNVISGNLSPSFGAIGCMSTSSPRIVSNTIIDNSSYYQELGVIGLCDSSRAEIKNNIISKSLGYGISCDPGANPTITYNDVWNNSSGNFCGCPPGIGDTSWGENCNKIPCDSFYNIIADPLFDPDSTNYFLLCNSPSIDAGDPSDPVPEGGGRFVDMGAVEYPYLCGDATGDWNVDISDVVYLLNYLFVHGPAPCPLGRADDNRDCEVDASDLVYELNYLFAGGPRPVCGGTEPSLANLPSKLYHILASAEISLSEPKFTKDRVGEITVTGKFDIELSAVQLEISYDPKQIGLIEPALTPRCEGLQLYFGAQDGQLKIGILDITGVHRIPAGEGPILILKAKAKDLSSLKISKAILVDQNANAFLANIVEKSERATSLPDQYSLHQNYPNPFNPETEISYDLPNDSWVKLLIYNISGQKVKTLVDRFEAAGHKTVTWDGRNQNDEQVASGVFFYRLVAGEFTATKKMVMIR